MSKQVPLTKGKFAIVDDEDYELVMQWKWYYQNMGYAARKPSQGKHYLMHRVIINAPEGTLVDHINRDRLDNRKSNLRLSLNSENYINKSTKRIGHTSKYRGVCYDPRTKWWMTQVSIGGKRVFFKRYRSEIDAAIGYNKHAPDFHGAAVVLNEINPAIWSTTVE
jgi:hypothetical protein